MADPLPCFHCVVTSATATLLSRKIANRQTAWYYREFSSVS